MSTSECPLKYACALCGYLAPEWLGQPPPANARLFMPMCLPKGLGAWRGHNFERVDARTTHPLPEAKGK